MGILYIKLYKIHFVGVKINKTVQCMRLVNVDV